MKIVDTHTGKIFVDGKNRLEFLTVGDYGKENNIKADFLGLHKEIHGVQHKDVDLSKKWVATISTQKGCPMKCAFCDCPKYGYYGNATREELAYEIRTMLEHFCGQYNHTDRFNVHFARMGEPTMNPNVLDFAEFDLKELVAQYIDAKTVHPVVSTMLPKCMRDHLEGYLLRWCHIKNEVYHGEAGLQFSINSTDDEQRNVAFNGMSLSLAEISELASKLPAPVGRKYTLNFAVTKDTILDADVLDKLFDKDRWIVKITPIHETHSAVANGFDVGDTYTDYDVYKKFEEPLLAHGWDVIVFVPSKEEDSDRITCGNALISFEEKYRMTKEDVQAIRKKSDDIQQFCIDEEKTNSFGKYLYHHLPMKDPEKPFLDADNWDLTKEERAFIEKGLKELETYHSAFFHDELAEDADVLPPWIAFPLYPIGTMGWRMGTGERYRDKWNKYLSSLTEEERSAYNRRFPLPLYMMPTIA